MAGLKGVVPGEPTRLRGVPDALLRRFFADPGFSSSEAHVRIMQVMTLGKEGLVSSPKNLLKSSPKYLNTVGPEISTRSNFR